MLKPAMDDILRDPTIYRHFRRRGVDIASGRVGGLGRLLWTGPWIGWVWFLGRGPWRVRQMWLKVVWWLVPLALGVWLFGLSVTGWLSMYFWFPVIAGWVWEKRINAYVAQAAKQHQYDEIEREINVNEMQAPAPEQAHAYDDPNRLKS